MAVFLVGLFLFLSASPEAPSLTVYLKRTAVVREPAVRLGDLAITAPDPRPAGAQEAALFPAGDNLELFPAPTALTMLPVRILRERLYALTGAGADLVGGRIGLVPIGKIPESEAWFYQKLLRYLEGLDADPEARLEIKVIEASPILPFASEAEAPPQVELSPLSFLRPQSRLNGELRLAWRIAGSAPGGRTGTLTLWIDCYIQAAFLETSLRPGQALEPRLISFREARLSELGGEPLGKGDEAAFYTAAVPLAKGRPILRSHLQRQTALRSGQEVTLCFRSGSLEVRSPGKVLKPGGIGETVEVRTLDSSQRFLGTAIGPREVEIVLP